MARTKTSAASVHVRLDPEKWQDLQLWCNSGVVRISATELVGHLLTAFYDDVVLHVPEFDIDAAVTGIRSSVLRAKKELAAKGAACG